MTLSNAIQQLEAMSLEQMDKVMLMNRTDTKYWFDASLLPEIIKLVAKDYFVLEIEGQRNMPYMTTYYDTPTNEMYQNHHRGKKNRYKIRRRCYAATGTSFLEVKFKNNKGRTIKNRIISNYLTENFNLNDQNFIQSSTPYSCNELQKVLINGFCRLMLIGKSLTERLTIDTNINFFTDNKNTSLENLVVLEVKRSGREASVIESKLKELRIKPSGFSKYCVGRSLICEDVKTNRFKKLHRKLDKNCELWDLNI